MPIARKTASGKWRCQVFDHTEIVNGKKKSVRRSFTADTKIEAERAALDFQRRKNTATCALSLYDAIDRYIEIKQNVLSPSTIRGYRTLQRNAYNGIAYKRLDRITSADIQDCLNLYARNHKAKGIKNALGLVTAVIHQFLPEAVIRATVGQSQEVDYYTPSDEDVKKLLSCIRNPNLYRAVLLSAFGTLRRSEICGLKDTDIDGNIIRIRRSVVRAEHGVVLKEYLKNDSSRRDILYPDFVISAMREADPGFLVDMKPDKISRAFNRARERAGLPYFRFHDLRSYSISIGHALGIPDAYLMRRGGWKTDATFKKVYRRTITDQEKRFAEDLNHHFAELTEDSDG